MMVSLAGDLWQVGDGQYLIDRREIREQTGEGRRRRAAETGVDLVKEQGQGSAGARRVSTE